MNVDLIGKAFTTEDGRVVTITGNWWVSANYVVVSDGSPGDEIRPASVIRRRLQLDGAL